MKRLFIIKNGSCCRCGQCCDKSKAQPMYWALMKETDDPDIRIINSTKGPKECPRVCESLGYVQPIEAVPDYSTNDMLGNPDIDIVISEPYSECHIYEDRPPLCRIFPRHPKDLMEIENCGYYFTMEWRDVE